MYNKIKHFCDEQKISINQMCINLGISPQSITNLKNRTENNPKAGLNVEAAAKIADFMGISVLELINQDKDSQ